jgi:hypothetical protein
VPENAYTVPVNGEVAVVKAPAPEEESSGVATVVEQPTMYPFPMFNQPTPADGRIAVVGKVNVPAVAVNEAVDPTVNVRFQCTVLPTCLNRAITVELPTVMFAHEGVHDAHAPSVSHAESGRP